MEDNACDGQVQQYEQHRDGADDDDDETKKTMIKTLHIAPMLDVTYREFRQLMRILSKRAVLWTEMVVDTTILHTDDLEFHLGYEQHNSHPIICQLGGNNPELLRQATYTVLQDFRYDEVNLNMDCPSNRVAGKRQFGAVLMKQLDVAESSIQAMSEASTKLQREHQKINSSSENYDCHNTPVISVKCRVGVDDYDTMDDLVLLIGRLSKHCSVFYLHARKAILGGLLSPAQNRSIPPLNYPRVYELCKLFPHCEFYINGGIKNLKAAKELCYGRHCLCRPITEPKQLQEYFYDDHHGTVPCRSCNFPNGSCVAPPTFPAPANLRGCLLGRVALDNPCVLWDVDRYFYGEEKNPCRTRRDILDRYRQYLASVYPRRCCDRNTEVTCKITDRKDFDFKYSYCSRCAELSNVDRQDGKHPNKNDVAPPNFNHQQCSDGKFVDIKVTIHVMNRSIKPILGIFAGLPKAKAFRRECDRLSRDIAVRNCGPAALIQRALLGVIPDELLDQPLLPTEQQ